MQGTSNPYDPEFNRYNLKVNGQVKFHGSTSEISHKAEDVFAWLAFIAPLKSGSVMDFVTIPDYTG
jgi:2-keto-4-pentenoate hydratase/2-oxohepta-3-ene-1,7-dioic acid hydratase in catechol pathway